MTQPTPCPTCNETLNPSGFDVGEILFCLHCHAECEVLDGHRLGPYSGDSGHRRSIASPYAPSDPDSASDLEPERAEASSDPFAPPKGSIQVSLEPSLRTFPPPGVLVAAVADLLQGVVLSGVSLVFMAMARVSGGFFTVIGLTLGVCFLASGLGLLRGMHWARVTQFVLNGLGILLCVLFAAGITRFGESGRAFYFWVIVMSIPNVLSVVLLSTWASREWFQNADQRDRDRSRSRR